MKLRPLNDTTVLKSTDNATEIKLAVTDNEDVVLDLSQYRSVSVAIGVNGTQYSSESVTLAEDNMSFAFTISHMLPASVYNIEVTLLTVDEKAHIAPSEGTFPLKIEKSMNELGETVVIMSVAELLNDIAIVKEQNDEAIRLVNENVIVVNEALATVNQANVKSDTALNIANNADNKADTAITDSSTALDTSNIALDTATTANDKSEIALANASNAEANSTLALNKATTAENTANQVRAEFDNITAGNTSAEVVAARTNASNVSFATVKARLDDADEKRVTGLANAIQTANAYTDNTIGNVDLSSVDEHINNADVHVTTADKTNWDNKVDKVPGKGLSTNDYTAAEKDKLSSLKNTVLSNEINDSTTTAITPSAVKSALSNVSADTSSLQINFIDLAIEVETSKNAELNAVTANIAIETFLTLDDVTLERGSYNTTNKWVEV